jgi:hypothetical protein
MLVLAGARKFTPAAIRSVVEAQSDSQNPSVPEPELVGKVFLLDANTHSLRQMSGEQWKRKTKTGWGSSKAINVVQGARSSFRVSSSDKIVFVFKPFPNSDLSQMKVYPFEVKSNERSCVIGMNKKGAHEGNSSVISLDAVKYGSSSYALTPPNSHLSPGEYWIAVPGAAGYNDPLITFGVD